MHKGSSAHNHIEADARSSTLNNGEENSQHKLGESWLARASQTRTVNELVQLNAATWCARPANIQVQASGSAIENSGVFQASFSERFATTRNRGPCVKRAAFWRQPSENRSESILIRVFSVTFWSLRFFISATPQPILSLFSCFT